MVPGHSDRRPPGQSGLAYLPGAEQGHHRHLGECAHNVGEQIGAGNILLHITFLR